MIDFKPSAKFDKQATLIFCQEDQLKQGKFTVANKSIAAQIQAVLKTGHFTAENGQIFPIIIDKKIILLAGIGAQKDFALTCFRIAVRKALLSGYLKKIKTIEIIPHNESDEAIKALIDAIVLGTYRWDKHISQSKKINEEKNKDYFLVAGKKKIYDDQIAICKGTNFARNLINENADTATSEHFEKTIKDLVKNKKNITLEILNKKELKAKGLGLHLAVNRGSTKEPKLIIVKYKGAGTDGHYTALVGKGVTFDTGGLNLKPSGSMETMRTDMSGAAAVTGVLKNTIALNLKKNVIFAIGLAENAIGPDAFKPGDVFTGYAGKSVEIANTDAEGRLVLADAISYVIKNYKPSRLIDIATLTGACVVALGHDYSGLVSTDDTLARQIVHSSNETDDRVWRLPSYPELKDSVKSQIADIRNLGYPKGAGGALTAAEFLRQFADGTVWAHLDIAGTSFVDNSCRWYFGHGGTGSGVRLLTNFLITN